MPPERSDSQEARERSADQTMEGGAHGQEFGVEQDRRAPAPSETPDVTLDVPSLNIEELNMRVENLRARISLQAELAETVRINVGVDAYFDGVDLELKGLEARALLEAHLDNVRDILGRTLETLDDNPQIVESLAQAAQDSGGGVLEGVAGTVGSAFQKQSAGGARGPGEGREEGADQINATAAARTKADELGLDLGRIEGTGSGGRIILRDVQQAARD